jgi:integrase
MVHPRRADEVGGALRRLGFTGDEQTGHGFRSIASTLRIEQGFPPDVIELQLTHAERNKVRAAYDKAAGSGDRMPRQASENAFEKCRTLNRT